MAGVLSAIAEIARRRGLLGPSPDEHDDRAFDDSDPEEEAEQAREARCAGD